MATGFGLALMVVVGLAISAEGKYTLQVPNGLAFSEFKGYESWQIVSVSHSGAGEQDEAINMIIANPVMIKAFEAGVPGNGNAFPDGSKAVKIQYIPKKNQEAPFSVSVPDRLRDYAFMVKDSKRFADSGGWGYGLFKYDSVKREFTPDGSGSKCGAACHTAVKAKDYVFTRYESRNAF
jgi:Cytochrome P460